MRNLILIFLFSVIGCSSSGDRWVYRQSDIQRANNNSAKTQAVRAMTGQEVQSTGNPQYDQQLQAVEALTNQNKKNYPKKYRVGEDGYIYAE